MRSLPFAVAVARQLLILLRIFPFSPKTGPAHLRPFPRTLSRVPLPPCAVARQPLFPLCSSRFPRRTFLSPLPALRPALRSSGTPFPEAPAPVCGFLQAAPLPHGLRTADPISLSRTLPRIRPEAVRDAAPPCVSCLLPLPLRANCLFYSVFFPFPRKQAPRPAPHISGLFPGLSPGYHSRPAPLHASPFFPCVFPVFPGAPSSPRFRPATGPPPLPHLVSSAPARLRFCPGYLPPPLPRMFRACREALSGHVFSGCAPAFFQKCSHLAETLPPPSGKNGINF